MNFILYRGSYPFKLIPVPVLHLMVKAAGIILAGHSDFIQHFTDFAILSSNILINESELLPIILTSRPSWLRSKMNLLLIRNLRVSDILNCMLPVFFMRNRQGITRSKTVINQLILLALDTTTDKNTVHSGTIISETNFTIWIKQGALRKSDDSITLPKSL